MTVGMFGSRKLFTDLSMGVGFLRKVESPSSRDEKEEGPEKKMNEKGDSEWMIEI